MESEEDVNDAKENPISEDEIFRTKEKMISEEQQIPKDSFLDESVSYSFPGFNCSVQNNVIILTLDVKNVASESFEKRILPDRLAVSFKFVSIGAGFVQIHHAFALDFLIGGSSLKEADV